MSRPYILLTGGDGGFGNLGDEFLLRAIKDLYRPYLDRYTVLIAQMRPPGREDEDGFVHVREDAKALEVLGIDGSRLSLLHYYGGGYLNEHWYVAKMRLYHALRESGLAPGRVIFSGNGVGPLDPERRTELEQIADESRFFSGRDRASAIGRQGQFTFDESIALYPPPVKCDPRSLRGPIAINVRTQDYVGLAEGAAASVLGSLDTYLGLEDIEGIAFGMVGNASYDESAAIAIELESAGAKAIRMLPRAVTFEQLAERLAACRAVVTTSYHVALTALYVGAPVVCLYASEYYRLKFSGLADAVRSPFVSVSDIDAFDMRVVADAARVGEDSAARRELHTTLADLKQLRADALSVALHGV